MASSPNPDIVATLDSLGVRLDNSGRIVDWANRPPQHARSFEQDAADAGRNLRRAFTPEEDQIIREWCTAADEEGVRGSTVFEQLECLYPNHTWQAYEGRWRKVLRQQAAHVLRTDTPYSNLDAHTSTPTEHAQETTVDTEPFPVNYADQRIETARVILDKLGLHNESELSHLLRLPWLIRAYAEFVDSSLSSRQAADHEAVERTDILPRASRGRAQHTWKIEKAIELVQTRGRESRYCQAHLDKSTWTDDDHDLRFLLRAVLDGSQEGQYWWHLLQQDGLRPICEQALWLMLWFRWLWKVGIGESSESRRLEGKKSYWKRRLEDFKGEISDDDPFSNSQPPSQAGAAMTLVNEAPINGGQAEDEMDISGVENATEDCPGDFEQDSPAFVTARSSFASDVWQESVTHIANLNEGSATRLTQDVPLSLTHQPSPRLASPSSSTSSGRLVKGEEKVWLSTEANQLYLNNRDRRLGSWGLTAEHRGTCVLVPADWAYDSPEQLLDKPSSWPRLETELQRLSLSIGPFRPLWARAAAWFEGWPRSESELVSFTRVVDNNKSQSSHIAVGHAQCEKVQGRQFRNSQDDGFLIQGSHLCHHGLCILPGHIVYEDKKTNLNRNSCRTAARALRMYKATIPMHCLKHNPPCLMQLAALTSLECFAIQFSVLRMAKGLPAGLEMARPGDHDPFYSTFEWRLPTEEPWPSVNVDPAHLVRESKEVYNKHVARYRRQCRFCVHPRSWGKMTAYWSHLKIDHSDEVRDEVLREVAESATAYQEWARRKFYNLERSNPATWAKIMQAKAPGFSWEVFTNWRLQQDRFYEGRRTN